MNIYNQPIGIRFRIFVNGPRDWGSILGCVKPKTEKKKKKRKKKGT